MKRQTLKSINRSYHTSMKRLTSKGREQEILAALRDGKNTYLRMDRLESSSFDSSWIEVIEDVIYDLGQIISNPRQVTKQEGAIVPVELARKTGAESVRHLASHTQYIKEIDDYGNVIPSKILTMYNEDDIRTYENRFIATLVRRLVLFVGKRYDFVSKFAELHDEQVLMFKNKSIVEGAEVEIETKIRINHKSDDDMSVKNNEYIERIKQMRQYILYFYNSDFMKKLKTEKDVHNPILQTNIIRKNPLYHHCYEVYRFIEKYEHLGVHYQVDEQFSVFDDKDLAEINNTIFANYITLKGKDRSNVTKGTNKVYKPKILTSIDDEMFVYGPRLAGPIEFVRVDEAYQKYLDSKVRKDLPLHPTKREKEYYAEEYKDKAENKEDLFHKEKLLKRVNKEVAAFNKTAAKIDQEREAARLALLEQEKQIIKKEEDDLLSAARSEIIAASLEEQKQVYKDLAQDQINAANVVEMSHPYEEPVTYEEATLQIWPQIANAPALRVGEDDEPVYQAATKETPIVEEENSEEPVVEEAIIPQEAEVKEYAHPYQEPLTYEEAALEIWPQMANAPALRVAPEEESIEESSNEEPQEVVFEEVPVEAPENAHIEEEPLANKEVEPQPAVVPEYTHPYSEPVSYDEAALEIWPQIANAPLLRVAPKEEQPAENKATVKKKVAKPAPKKEEKKTEKAPVEKPVQPVKEAVSQEEPKETESNNERRRPKIPGRFIVKTDEGYYVNENETSNYKEGAKVFDDFNLAADVKKQKGGRIIKLLDEDIPTEAPVVAPAPEEAKETPEVKVAPEKKEKKAPVKKAAPKVEAKEKPQEVKPAPIKKEAKPVVKKAVPTKAKAAPNKEAKPAVKIEERPRPKIPGRFIVKTSEGYYVAKNKYSIYKEDAKIFDDFNLALDIKKEKGGKVVKV